MLRAIQTCFVLAVFVLTGCQKQQVEEIEAKTTGATGPTMSQEDKEELMGGEQTHLEKPKKESKDK
jgi:hypothetical protein